MKKLLLLTALLSCFAFYAFKPGHHGFSSYDHTVLDSFPNTVKTSSDSNRNLVRGMLVGGQGLQFTPYADTGLANLSPIHTYPGAAISVKGQLFVRDSTATKWDRYNGGGGSNITIINDSSISICNFNSCDTFTVSNITINNFHILNDSTIQVCDTTGVCDTININPTPFNKTFVDSVKVGLSPDTVAVDTIRYYIDGNAFLGGYIIGRKDTIYVQYPLYVYVDAYGHRVIAIKQQDGLISGGIVTWSGQGLIFNITAATYVLNGNYYSSPAKTDTLSAADATYSRTDLFIVDTTGEAGHLTGIPAPVPTVPQVDPASQIPLTSGITINVGDTIPNQTQVQLQTIYDENLGTPSEWAYSTSGTITANANSTVNPYHLTKDIYVSKYSKNSKINFLSASIDTVNNGDILKGWIYFNGAFLNSFKFQLFNGATAVSNAITVQNNFGINPNDSNQYQLFAIPLSAFTFTSQYYNKLVITHVGNDNSGAKGYYLDYLQIQRGIIPVAPPTDYSNKQDSNHVSNDSLFWCVKGVCHFVGMLGGGGTADRFGIEDSTGVQNRAINFSDFNIKQTFGAPDYSDIEAEQTLSKTGFYSYIQNATGDNYSDFYLWIYSYFYY